MFDDHRYLAILTNRDIKDDGPTADLAVFDVLLCFHRTIQQYAAPLTAIGTLDDSADQFIHELEIYRSADAATQNRLDGDRRCGSAIIRPDFGIHLLKVFINRPRTHLEDFCDFAIGFAVGEP